MDNKYDEADWKRLGDFVGEIIDTLDLTANDVAEQAGIDPNTVRRIRAGNPSQSKKRRALEAAFGLAPGTLRRVLEDDGEIEELLPASVRRARDFWAELSRVAWEVETLRPHVDESPA